MTMWANISSVAPRRVNRWNLYRGLKPTATITQPLRGEECADFAAERQPKVAGRFNARNSLIAQGGPFVRRGESRANAALFFSRLSVGRAGRLALLW